MDKIVSLTPEERLEKLKNSPPPELKEIPLSKLAYPNFQRKRDEQHVKKILRSDPTHIDLGVLTVVPNGSGKYWVVDGGHRDGVHDAIGLKKAWCIIYHGVSYEDACKAFVKGNSGKRVSGIDKWRASREMRNPETLMVDKIMKDADWGVSGLDAGRFRVTQSPKTLASLAAEGNLASVLTFINAIWPSAKSRVVGTRTFLVGVSIFIDAYYAMRNRVPIDHLIRKMKKISAGKVKADAAGMHTHQDMKAAIAIAAVLAKHYNKNLGDKKRISTDLLNGKIGLIK